MRNETELLEAIIRQKIILDSQQIILLESIQFLLCLMLLVFGICLIWIIIQNHQTTS